MKKGDVRFRKKKGRNLNFTASSFQLASVNTNVFFNWKMLSTHERQVDSEQGKFLPPASKAFNLKFHNKSFTLSKDPSKFRLIPPNLSDIYSTSAFCNTDNTAPHIHICVCVHTTVPNLQNKIKFNCFLLKITNTDLETPNMQKVLERNITDCLRSNFTHTYRFNFKGGF